MDGSRCDNKKLRATRLWSGSKLFVLHVWIIHTLPCNFFYYLLTDSYFLKRCTITIWHVHDLPQTIWTQIRGCSRRSSDLVSDRLLYIQSTSHHANCLVIENAKLFSLPYARRNTYMIRLTVRTQTRGCLRRSSDLVPNRLKLCNPRVTMRVVLLLIMQSYFLILCKT